MKYVIVILDGVADYPIELLGHKTPLEAACKPALDRLARMGQTGLCKTVPDGFKPGSDVCIMNIMGYDPVKYFSGRAPLEAAAMGVTLTERDMAYRCNTVTIENGIMADFTAGHITDEEARKLIVAVDEELGHENLRFIPGVSYRHLAVVTDHGRQVHSTPPHDIIGQPIEHFLPSGKDADYIRKIMHQTQSILREHKVNQLRIEQGKKPVTDLWLWGQGPLVNLPSYQEMYQLQGAMITAVNLLKGIAKLAGLQVIDVPGATGYIDTDYRAKAIYALKALESVDLVIVHVESTDESGHEGNGQLKVKAIEDFDTLLLSTLMEGLKARFSEHRILFLPDHYTPCAVRTHTGEPVPFIIAGKGIEQDYVDTFSESNVNSNNFIEHGYSLISKLQNM